MKLNFDYAGLDVTAYVREMRDAYGTGDSPTLYDIEILKMIDEDGQEVDERQLSSIIYDQIHQEAIDQYKG